MTMALSGFDLEIMAWMKQAHSIHYYNRWSSVKEDCTSAVVGHHSPPVSIVTTALGRPCCHGGGDSSSSSSGSSASSSEPVDAESAGRS